MRTGNIYEINENDVLAIRMACDVLREHIQARGAQTAESLQTTREAFISLMIIAPRLVSISSMTRPWRGPNPEDAA